MKALVILSGSGVFDGSEIHEAVLTLLALEEEGIEYQCTAPNVDQAHVVNHTNGEEMDEKRNAFVEAARIARGSIVELVKAKSEEFDALVLPGGFGAAKNLSRWAFDGPEAKIDEVVKRVILEFFQARKPILAMCIAPTAVALSLQGTGYKPKLTVGTTDEPSPYDISGINQGLSSVGAEAVMSSVADFVYDESNNIITTPCYMQEAKITQVRAGIQKAVGKLKSLV
jgi:enhancing lycopene biosynthesis protein 2